MKATHTQSKLCFGVVGNTDHGTSTGSDPFSVSLSELQKHVGLPAM